MATRRPSAPPEATESLLSRLIIAPVLFISFLISLLLIDRQTSANIFSRSTTNKDGYYHSHQRKLAKREMDDAFQMRGKVIAVMVLCMGVGLGVLAWLGESLWSVWSGRGGISPEKL
jgi:hypothetical protein